MSDKKSNRPAAAVGPDGGEKTTTIQHWGHEVNATAKIRRMKKENELGEQMVRYRDIQVALSDADARVLEAQVRNSDIETIKEKAAKQLKSELGEVDAKLQAQEVRTAQLKAEAGEIVGRHEANLAEDVRRGKEAEAATLDAEISIETKRQKLDQLRNNRMGMLAEAEKAVADLQAQVAEAEKAVNDLSLDPTNDSDESLSFRLRAATQKRDDLRAQLTAAEKRAEDLH